MPERWQDPFGRTLFEQRNPDGSVSLDAAPGQWVCDFCMAPGPTWEFPVKGGVVIVGHPNIHGTDDEWAACDRCKELIEAGDLEAAVSYMVRTQRAQPLASEFTVPSRRDQVRFMRANLRAFLRVKAGDARPIRR